MTPIAGMRNKAKITRPLLARRGFLEVPRASTSTKKRFFLSAFSSASKLKNKTKQKPHIALSLILHEIGQGHGAWE